MRYMGMDEKEFLAYTLKMVKICIEAQLIEKEWLKKQGVDGVYDQ